MEEIKLATKLFDMQDSCPFEIACIPVYSRTASSKFFIILLAVQLLG